LDEDNTSLNPYKVPTRCILLFDAMPLEGTLTGIFPGKLLWEFCVPPVLIE